MARRQIEVSNEVATELAGSQDRVLRELEDQLGCEIFLRGNLVTLDGDAEAVANAATVVRELGNLVGRGHDLGPATVESVTSVLGQQASPAQVLEDVVWRHRSLRIAPKSVNQKRYVDAIREHTVTFGIGPAGTGKTFLAIAMAVAALSRREVNRIILTRPAVEAGERLGFLPGDLMAKVDPYLRPLFDAMNDMLDPERVTAHLEKGVIEVAPLAFMRGRAQPVDQPVLTPDGWRAIGSLRVGDLVVGSDGKPTPVLGVYPQGRRPVYRLTAQDGASTRCCAEHLWTVTIGGVVRTVRTDALPIGSALPLLSGPARLEPRGGVRTVGRHSHPDDARGGVAAPPRWSLHDAPDARLATLRELLRGDVASGRDDIVDLARSLGGTAQDRDGKLNVQLAQLGGRPMRFVDSIEPDGEAETACIQVAAADSLYVTDDFLLTHNTLNDSFVILDEAQNTSPEQMKMFLTRLGFGSKMVVNGDVSQIDLPRESRSGLVEVGEILRGVEGVEVIHFGNADVVRHKLVQRIVQAYADHAEQSAPNLSAKRRA